jgi:hypothetical protein
MEKLSIKPSQTLLPYPFMRMPFDSVILSE